MSIENTTITTAPGAAPTHSEANEAPGTDRLFTQAELDRIISDRLARERAKGEPSPLDQRERDLAAREGRLTCHEYIEAEGFPADLLDILPTDDPEKFKGLIQRLDELLHLPNKNRKPAPFVRPTGHQEPPNGDAALANAFRPK